MPAAEARDLVERELPDLLDFLRDTVPALAARPVLGAILTALVHLGTGTFFEYRERVRSHPIVPYAIGHRATRRELAAYVRRRPELAALQGELAAAEAATGDDARRRWEALRAGVGAAQADLAAPLAGSRGAVERLDGFLTRLVRAGTVNLPRAEKRGLLELLRERLGAEDA